MRATHVEDLRQVLIQMRKHNLRMNPTICVFFTEAGDFLGFLVHQRGIEIPKDKAQMGATEFVWEPQHQEAFDRIKNYLTNPPVLVPPRPGIPLKLYIAAADLSIGGLLAQDDENEVEHAVYYLSRVLTDCETLYSPMKKLCLALFFADCKLRHYMLAFTTVVIAQSDLVKYMFSRPILQGRIGKWILALSEFSLQYVPQRAVKGQVIADFLAHHPPTERISSQVKELFMKLYKEYKEFYPWVGNTYMEVDSVALMYIDGSANQPIIDVWVERLNKFVALRKSKKVVEICNKVDTYLMEAPENLKNKGSELSAWWKENTPKYLILSKVAKDVFAIPISTVASESAFSLGKRIVDPFRSSLTPKMVEALVCCCDWLRAKEFCVFKEPSAEALELYKKCEEVEVEMEKLQLTA
ncbi:hypothetical protein ACLB2K_073989 [Fragaria x ananassa]